MLVQRAAHHNCAVAHFPGHNLTNPIVSFRINGTGSIERNITAGRCQSGRLPFIRNNQGEEGLNEKRIQQVLEIEKQAREAYEAAIAEAREIPRQAEQEAQLIIEKARAEAEAQARQLVESAQSDEESARILSQTDEKIKRTDALAASNFERAVMHLLCRVVGRE